MTVCTACKCVQAIRLSGYAGTWVETTTKVGAEAASAALGFTGVGAVPRVLGTTIRVAKTVQGGAMVVYSAGQIAEGYSKLQRGDTTGGTIDFVFGAFGFVPGAKVDVDRRRHDTVDQRVGVCVFGRVDFGC